MYVLLLTFYNNTCIVMCKTFNLQIGTIMSRTSKQSAFSLYRYALPKGRHQEIVDASALFASFARPDMVYRIERGFKPEIVITTRKPGKSSVHHKVTVQLLWAKEHVAAEPRGKTGAGLVVEVFGKAKLHDQVVDVCMKYYNNYNIGVIAPVDTKNTLEVFPILQKQKALREHQAVR